MNSIWNTISNRDELKSKYDAAVKELLSSRQLLARILKRVVPEYAESSLEDIQNKYIEPSTISVSKTGVARNTTNIDGISTEDATLNEGNIKYDILFESYYPGTEDQKIGLYINIEVQNNAYPGYPIETRAMYYAARRFSSELRSLSLSENYNELKKVYSIWLCLGNVPNKETSTITLYRTEKSDILGLVERDRRIYDMMNVIILRVNDNVVPEDDLLKLLQTLCSKKIPKKKKLENLAAQGIELGDAIVEGVNHMCNLSDAIETQGIQQGIQQGAQQREKEIALEMLKGGMSCDLVAKYTKIPVDTLKEWMKEITNH